MLTTGQTLEGKYKVGRLLSRGGMGAVFAGEHARIKRNVAIKVLHDDKIDSENAQRFEREAEAAGRIGSDHIVEVLDFGTTPDGERFMVMEYLDGETLKTRLKSRGRLDPHAAIPIVMQILQGLSAAHAAGIIHRDLKPDNVFILKEKAGRADFVKIVDFGISKFDSLTNDAAQMTQTGAVMGTPFYMSPEQARASNEVDSRSDLYSVGVLLYEAVTGAVPFKGTTLTELLFKIVFEDPVHPNSLVPELDSEFVGIILKAMARDSAARFQTASEMQGALAHWQAARAAGVPAAAWKPGPPPARTAALPMPPPAQPPIDPRAYAPVDSPFAKSVGNLAQTAQLAPQSPQLARPITFSDQRPVAPTMVGSAALDTQKVWDAPPAPPKSSRAGMFVLLGVVVVVLGGVGVVLFTRGAGQTTAAPATTVATAAAPEPPRSAPADVAPTASSASASAPPSASVRPPDEAREAPTAIAGPAGRFQKGTPVVHTRTPPPEPTVAPPVAAPARQPAGAGTVRDFGY